MVFCCLDNCATAGVAQSPVGDDRVIFRVLQFFNGVRRGGAGGNLVASSFQDCALQFDDVLFVVHTKDSCHIEGASNDCLSAANLKTGKSATRYSAAPRQIVSNRTPATITSYVSDYEIFSPIDFAWV